ncbi:MAG: ATP-grasp domain-containing protein, partial [bacterium]|nr:ATP-grasp domain-containing protein [bacterium]
QLAAYAESAPPIRPGAPLLVDKYLAGLEVEVDAVYDGEDILIPGIFEHVERAGVHSGDSIGVYPTQHVSEQMQRSIAETTREIAHALGIRGLINIQYIVADGRLYVIEANPRASRTVPIISKVTGCNLVAAATRIALGERLREMPYGTGLLPRVPFVVVKAPVFSFTKLRGVETILGPEMKSTGEVLGIDPTFAGALRKGFQAAGVRIPSREARVLASIAKEEKEQALPLLRRLADLGCRMHATPGTCAMMHESGIGCEQVNKISEPSPTVIDFISGGGADLVVNNMAAMRGREATDGYRIRRAAVEAGVACITSTDTLRALVEAMESQPSPPQSLQSYLERIPAPQALA